MTELDGNTNNGIVATYYNDGFEPNVCTLGELVALYSDSESSPFNFRVNAQHTYLNKTATTTYFPVMKQLVVLNEDSSIAQYGICLPNIADDEGTISEISWKENPDSTLSESSNIIDDLLQTNPFTIPPGGIIEYATDIYAESIDGFESEFAFELRVIDTSSGTVLTKDVISVSSLPSDSAMYLVYKFDISEYEGEVVSLSLGLADTTNISCFVRNICLIDPPELDKQQAGTLGVPQSITLSNYPNPFNPSTDITYGIPEETHVKLAVYDNLGREVKVLANGWKAAGTYTVTFDAADLPSGMYLYRIETSKGSVSKKMMLMK